MFNKGQEIGLPLAVEDSGLNLTEYLTRHADWFRGIDLAAALRRGAFRLDGRVIGEGEPLPRGGRLVFWREPWCEPTVPTEVPVLFEDEDVLVVDKPAGLPITPSGDFLEHTLLHLLRREHSDLSPAHRLDLETSGVLLLVKRPRARGFYQRQFQRGRVKKRYLAMVHGWVSPGLDVIDTPLARDERIYTKFVADPAGKPALSRIHTVCHGPRRTSLLELEPVTGRTNQLRAHLAAVGHPIVGDKKYHPDPALFLSWLEHRDTERLLDRLWLPRQALHCASLGFTLRDGRQMVIISKRRLLAEWENVWRGNVD